MTPHEFTIEHKPEPTDEDFGMPYVVTQVVAVVKKTGQQIRERRFCRDAAEARDVAIRMLERGRA